MATETFATQLEGYKKGIDKAKTDRARAEATKEQLEKQQDAIIQEIRALGVEPEQLDQTITELETGIGEDLARLETLIPAEYLKA